MNNTLHTSSTIDPQNGFEVAAMDKSKPCRSGYVRLVRFLGKEKHNQQQMFNGDLLGVLTNGGIFHGEDNFTLI